MTSVSRRRAVEYMRKEYGEDIYAKIGSLGGKKMHQGSNPNQPMRDPAFARRAANIRWLKYRLEKGVITKDDYKAAMLELRGGSTANV